MIPPPSRSNFQSPLSHNQEVAAYGTEDSVDYANDWVVNCRDRQFWIRDSPVSFKHRTTDVYLHHDNKSQYGRPIAGQREVCGVGGRSKQNRWKALDGVYWKFE